MSGLLTTRRLERTDVQSKRRMDSSETNAWLVDNGGTNGEQRRRLLTASRKESGYTMLIGLDETGIDKPGVSRRARLDAARERDRVSDTRAAVHKQGKAIEILRALTR